MPRDPKTRKGAAPADPALVAEGLALIAAGATPESAAEEMRTAGRSISSRTLRRAMPARDTWGEPSGPAGRPPTRPKPPIDELELELGADDSDADTLALARRLLRTVVLRTRHADPSRFASLIEKANGLIGRVEQIEARRPKTVAPDAVIEELKRLDLEAIAMIEQHLGADKITTLEDR